MKELFPVVLILAALNTSAQTDSSIFNSLKKVEVAEYVFAVPQAWGKTDLIDISSVNRKFNFTGVGLPENFKGSPLTACFELRKNICDSLRPAVDFVLNELTSYPDRITPPGQNYTKDTLAITSGEDGVLFSTHYYRRTKALNYSRYDCIVYSKKRRAAYLLNVTYQYRDSSYSIENDLKLREYALRVFKSLILR